MKKIKEKRKEILTVTDEVRINENIILEKGDKIQIVNESLDDGFDDLKRFFNSKLFKNRKKINWYFESFMGMIFCDFGDYSISISWDWDGDNSWRIGLHADEDYNSTDIFDLKNEEEYPLGSYTQNEFKDNIIPLFHQFDLTIPNHLIAKASTNSY